MPLVAPPTLSQLETLRECIGREDLLRAVVLDRQLAAGPHDTPPVKDLAASLIVAKQCLLLLRTLRRDYQTSLEHVQRLRPYLEASAQAPFSDL